MMITARALQTMQRGLMSHEAVEIVFKGGGTVLTGIVNGVGGRVGAVVGGRMLVEDISTDGIIGVNVIDTRKGATK